MNIWQKLLAKVLGKKVQRIWIAKSQSNPRKTYPIIAYINRNGVPTIKHGDCMGYRYNGHCHHVDRFFEKRGLPVPPHQKRSV